ncbi:MAG TPA: DinB family protein, partial [Thermoanaerobaculia bacterium]|nr:DinB family protein [Thermoanaerobaculia bacterium]
EQPMFNSVMRALPGDKLGYKPHEKSNSAGTIAWMMAEELKSICDVLDKGTVEWAPRPEPKDAGAIANEFESQGRSLEQKLQSIDDSAWNSKGAFVAGGKEVFSASRGDMAWWILFDLIHHRGQLSAYIRPMGGKVPGIYGPSGDDAGQS